MKRRLLISLLGCTGLVAGVAGTTLFVASTDAGARWVMDRIDAALGGNLNWAAAEGTLLSGMRLADVALDDGSSLLRMERLEFAWQPWRLLDGTLVLDSVNIAGLRHQTRVSGAPLTENALRSILFDAPFAVVLRAFRVDAVELVGVGGAVAAIDLVTGSAMLDGGALTLTDLEVRQGETRVDGALSLSAELTLSGRVDWQTEYAGLAYAGTLTVAGSLRRPELGHELLQPVQLTTRGALVSGFFTGDTPGFDLQHAFALQSLAAFGQPELQLQGNVRTVGTPDEIDIDGTARAEVAALAPFDLGFALTYRDAALVIDNATLASTQVGLQGKGLLEFEPVALHVDWSLDALDAGDRVPQLQLEGVAGTGSLQLAQSDDGYSGSLQLDALTGTLNGYPLSVTGLLRSATAGIAVLQLQVANGSNTFSIDGTAGEELALDWDIQAPELGALWQGLSGRLAGSGRINGTQAAPQVRGTLNGALRLARPDEVLELGMLALNAEYGADANDLSLELGSFTRTAGGTTSTLLQRATITLSGTPAAHTLRADLAGPADALRFSLQGAAANGDWRGTLQNGALDSRAGDWQLETPVALAYSGDAWTMARNCWAFLQTRLCMEGGKPAARGIDVELALTAMPLTWLNPAADTTDAKPAALQQLQDALALNLPATVRTEGTLDAQVSLRNFNAGEWDSLDVVLQPHDWVVQIRQQVEEGAEEAPLVQRFGLDMNLGEVHSRARTWGGTVDVRVTHLEDGRSEAQGTFQGSGELSADGEVSGSAAFAFGDMGWLEFLVPDVRDPTGILNGTVGLGGTRAQPLLQANVQLSNGAFDLPLYGLNIRNARFELDTDASNVLRVEGSAQSGEGLLQVSAEVSNLLQPTRVVSAALTGTDFLAMATDYASIRLSPELHGNYADAVLTMNGRVEMTNSELELEDVFGAGAANGVSVSRDVVIVRGEQAPATAAQDALRVTADVAVQLGDKVHVTGYDLDAYLNGELRVEQAPGRPMLVYGELGIPEGRYEIYNQQLNARDGRLVFFGNPANPLLDVRAFRAIDSGEVGVHLTGNLDSIQGRLYSTPALPDQEALALLVTGKSFSSVNAEESDALVGAIASFGLRRGEGLTERVGSTLGLDSLTLGGGNTLEDSALGLGKYLTPDLLMRYKLGLFDRQSVLGIEYTLSERLKLEVETGISQSVDLSYTIEKD